jgi:uncharacterized protein YndB with AHSA1/START domain
VVERQVIIPLRPAALWEALTQPEQVSAWFGHLVEWDLVPGGRARWTRPDGDDTRLGVIDDVTPSRRLCFRWWPESGGGVASQVTYELEPADNAADADGHHTRLTVREAPIVRPSRKAPEAHDAPEAPAEVTSQRNSATTAAWTAWDTRQAGLWLHASALAGVRA